MAKSDELHRLIIDVLADDPRAALIACRHLADNDRAVARYQRALRLAQEFEAFAEDGSDVTPW